MFCFSIYHQNRFDQNQRLIQLYRVGLTQANTLEIIFERSI